MQVVGDKNKISEDVFDFMVSYLPIPQKSIRSELAKLFLHTHTHTHTHTRTHARACVLPQQEHFFM